MSDLAIDTGRRYLDGMYERSGVALSGVIQDVRGNQFEVSRLIGEVLALHDSQDALVWRNSARKVGLDLGALYKMVGPAVDILREVRTKILALGIDDESESLIIYALGEVHSGSDIVLKNLNLEEVE